MVGRPTGRRWLDPIEPKLAQIERIDEGVNHPRRCIDHELRRLLRQDLCSFCSKPFEHNTRTAGGFDKCGDTVLACECCIGRVAVTLVRGFYTKRLYDFLEPRGRKPKIDPTEDQITEGLAACQKAISETDKQLNDTLRRAGVKNTPHVSLLDYPWKDDDRAWFEQRPDRSHRARAPYPDELPTDYVPKPPPGSTAAVLLRQVEPGVRAKAVICLTTPHVPDHEALIHALFEIATGREPMPANPEAFFDLVEKYTACREPVQ